MMDMMLNYLIDFVFYCASILGLFTIVIFIMHDLLLHFILNCPVAILCHTIAILVILFTIKKSAIRFSFISVFYLEPNFFWCHLPKHAF